MSKCVNFRNGFQTGKEALGKENNLLKGTLYTNTNTNFIPLSYIEHVKHEAYVQKRKYLCSVMAAIEKTATL